MSFERSAFAVALVLAAGQALAAPTVLRASHQFPGGKGDVRDDMVQMIAKEAKAANVDLDIQVYPGASLFKPEQQWNAMVNGQLDITLFPLDYASGQVRDFSATAIELHGKASSTAEQQAWALGAVRKPVIDESRSDRIYDEIRALAGAYAMAS